MKKNKILLLLIIAAATLVRLFHLTSISLWHDEAFSALLINYSWKEMFYRIGLDVHPPFYYVLLRLWADVFGHSLWALRGFSVLFGVLTVWATYLFVKTAFKKESVALGAALLVAINPFQIQYVTEARMYTLGTFLVMISAYFMVKAFDREKEKPNNIAGAWKYWLPFVVATAGAMYTHYYLFFSVFGIGLFGLYYIIKTHGNKLSHYINFVAAYVLVLILFVPWLKTFLFQFHQVQENYWIPKINKWSVVITNWRMITGAERDPVNLLSEILLVLGVLFSIYMIYKIVKQDHTSYKWLALLALIVPFVGSLLLSLKQSIYLDRYFLFAALFYTVALAIFIFELKDYRLRYLLFAIAVLVSFVNWVHFWTDLNITTKPGMAAAAQYLNNNVEANDKLDVGSSFEFFNFKYYNHTPVAPLLYTPGLTSVNQLPHFSGTAILTDADLIHDLNAHTKSGDTTWILWTNAFGGSKPSTPANWIQINEKGFEDVRPYPGTWIVVTQYKVK